MSKREILLWIVLADFVALTAWAVHAEGLLGFVAAARTFVEGSAWGAQILIDFGVAVTVALGFVIADARRRGLVWWPFAVLTLTLGSIGPLAYLVFRERAGAMLPGPAPATQHA